MVVALLAAVKEADFQYLLHATELPKGIFRSTSRSWKKPARSKIEKTFRGKYALTICRLSRRGREQLDE